MAVSAHHLLQIAILLALELSAASRPCPYKTIVLFSISSSSYRNPSLTPSNLFQSFSFIVFFSDFKNFYPKPALLVDRIVVDKQTLPLRFGFYQTTFNNCSKDILQIIGSLLAGASCGALIVATIYLIWSHFTPKRIEFTNFNDFVSPNTMEYIPIMTVEANIIAPLTKEVI